MDLFPTSRHPQTHPQFQKHPDNSSSIPVEQPCTKTFQCQHCPSSFKTYYHYDEHIKFRHSNNFSEVARPELPSNDPEPNRFLQDPFPNKPNSNSSSPHNTHSQNLAQSEISDSPQNSQSAEHQSQPSRANYNDSFNEDDQSDQEYQKITNFKYLTTYHQHKMAPFYRQYDIGPIQSHNSSISKQLNRFFKQSPIEPRDSIFDLYDNAFNDQKKVDKQFNARLLPTQNSFIKYIDSFIQKNIKKILKLSQETKRNLRNRLQKLKNQLNQLATAVGQKENDSTRIENKIEEQEQDFMNLSLLRELNNFIYEFLMTQLRKEQTYVVQAIEMIILENVHQYYSANSETMKQNLKVCDFSWLYSEIKTSVELKNLEIPYEITCETMAEFVIYFNHWCSVKQYISNKSRVSYIEPLKNQIDAINELYRENVMNFKKITKNRRQTYHRRMERKLILKKSNQVKKEYIGPQRDLRQIYNSYGIDPNMQIIYDNVPRKIQKIRKTIDYDPFNKFYNDYKQKEDDQNDHQIVFQTPSYDRIYSNDHRYSENYRKKQQHFQDNFSFGLQNGKSHNEALSESSMSEEFQKQCMYVDYFDEKSVEQRQKNQLSWKAALNLFKRIMSNPKKFKPILKHKVKKQIFEVNTSLLRLRMEKNSPELNHAVSKFKFQIRKFYPNGIDFSQEDDQVINNYLTNDCLNINETSDHVSSVLQDPFQVLRNHRKKTFDKNAEKVKDLKFNRPEDFGSSSN